jgi:hypothetical protein
VTNLSSPARGGGGAGGLGRRFLETKNADAKHRLWRSAVVGASEQTIVRASKKTVESAHQFRRTLSLIPAAELLRDLDAVADAIVQVALEML